MKKVFFILTFLICISSISAQNKNVCTLEIELKGKTYDKVRLEISVLNMYDHEFYGETDDNKVWRFQYPDSIYEKHTGMKLFGTYNGVDNDYRIMVNMPFGNDTLKYDSFTVNKHSKVSAIFSESKESSYRDKILYMDSFIFNGDDDDAMYQMANALNEGYSLFFRDSLDYNQRIEKYQTFSLNYPDSHYLMQALASSISRYEDKEDISKVYNNFSSKNKESYFGSMIKDYLDMNYFDNMLLLSSETNEMEYIIRDSTKHNLVIFSASWCSPCHEQIPNFKKIYHDLHDKLDMVYVSIDDSSTVEKWKALMVSEEIPWRNLLAVENVQGVINKYFIRSIPHAFLILPSGKIHRLKLHEEKDMKLMYYFVNGGKI